MPIINHQNERGVSKPLAITIFAAFAIWMLLLFSFSQGQKINDKFAGQVDASMELRLEAAYAHLWFEEMVSSDKGDRLQDSVKNIDNAIWFANALLSGGSNAKGDYKPLETPSLRSSIEEVVSQLQEFKRLTTSNFNSSTKSIKDDNLHASYESTFNTIITIGEEVESNLNIIKQQELADFKNKHFLIAVVVLIITFGILLRIKTNETLEIEQDKEIIEEHELKVEQAHTDPLTGVGNRRAFTEKLDFEFKQAMRCNTPVSLMSIRMDFYDEFVAQFGQEQADGCLKIIAATLKDICSSTKELVARCDSEFAVIIPNTTHAKQIADAMILAVRNDAQPNLASKTGDIVTISIGLVNMHPEEGLLLPEEFTSNSHTALRQAITAGGNQVVEYQEPEDKDLSGLV